MCLVPVRLYFLPNKQKHKITYANASTICCCNVVLCSMQYYKIHNFEFHQGQYW